MPPKKEKEQEKKFKVIDLNLELLETPQEKDLEKFQVATSSPRRNSTEKRSLNQEIPRTKFNSFLKSEPEQTKPKVLKDQTLSRQNQMNQRKIKGPLGEESGRGHNLSIKTLSLDPLGSQHIKDNQYYLDLMRTRGIKQQLPQTPLINQNQLSNSAGNMRRAGENAHPFVNLTVLGKQYPQQFTSPPELKKVIHRMDKTKHGQGN